ncbi:MAG: hypothetical protein II933_02775 [Candidatus Methanomethylophilaceae archaeon]|nr:hypothetical protein [Candidatus Methanomethylophilaceae archaeon]
MGFQEFKVRMLGFYRTFPVAIAMVMGALMVIRGTWQLYGAMVNGGTIPNMAAFIIMAVAGAFIILWGRRDLVRTVGLYAITLGLTRVLMRYDAIVNPSSNILVVIVSWILFLLALNLIYTGISFARGMVIRRASMIATAFAFIGLNVFLMALPLAAMGIQTLDNTTRFIEVVMYIVLILMLDAESIRFGTSDGRHAKHLDRVRASYRAEPWAFITPDEAENLLSGTGPMWREIGDGIVEREMVLRVSGRDIETTVVVQKWCGEDILRFNVTPNSGTIVFANKLAVERIVRDGVRIRFYGRDGTDFVYSVKEAMI